MKLTKLMAALCCLWLTGCAGVLTGEPLNPADAQAVYRNTTISHDPYKNETRIDGPLIFEEGFVINDGYSAFITKKPDGSKTGGIFFAARFEEWAGLEVAYADGKKYPLLKISQKVESCGRYGCRLTEAVGLNLTIGQVRRLANELFFSVKLVGRTGQKIFNIPGAYFEALLKKMEEA